jgi:hypothetical protein
VRVGAPHALLAMQKVEGSNRFSRFPGFGSQGKQASPAMAICRQGGIAGYACRQPIALKDGAGSVSQPGLLSCLTGVDDPSIKDLVMLAPHPHHPPGRQQIAEATVAAVEHGSRGVYNVVDDEPAPVPDWLPAPELGARKPRAKREPGWLPRHPSWRQGFAAA